jgi:hypothetical protein
VKRATVYLKIQIDFSEPDTAQKIAEELCRMVEKQAVVRRAEPSSVMED